MLEKSEESIQHLKPLYIRGHIDGRSISRMLFDGDAAVNLMSYSMFKKLGREDDELVKSMEARGVVSMGFTVGRKSLSTTFFIV
jgi:hypothetical protein